MYNSTFHRTRSVALALCLALGLGACGMTTTEEEKKDSGSGKIGAVSTEFVERAISNSDIHCPGEYSIKTARQPNTAQAATVSGIVDIVHNCFSRTDKRAFCRIVGQEHYLKNGKQRNYLSSDTCGSYGLFDANRDNRGQPVCLSGCDD